MKHLSCSLLIATLAAAVPAAAQTSTEVLDRHVTAVFDSCIKAVQTHSDVTPLSINDTFVVTNPKRPDELQSRAALKLTLNIRGKRDDSCILVAQNSADDNRAIAKLLREKLQAAQGKHDKHPLVHGGDSWLVPAASGSARDARVTLESVWNDALLVIHFVGPSAPRPVPVPSIPPPPAPPPPPPR